MKKINKYKHIIWDWNGTLLDDGWLFVDIMNSILSKRCMKEITLEEYKNIFGFPVKEYYKKLGFDFSEEPFEKCGLEFIDEYKKRRYEANLYTQVIPILCKLNKLGVKNSILSAQHQLLLDDLVQYYNIHSYFDKISGLDNYYADSKVKNGSSLINLLNIDPKHILMIGDTDHDFEVAQNLKVDCYLICNGHQSKSKLKQTGANLLNDLDDILFSLNAKTLN